MVLGKNHWNIEACKQKGIKLTDDEIDERVCPGIHENFLRLGVIDCGQQGSHRSAVWVRIKTAQIQQILGQYARERIIRGRNALVAPYARSDLSADGRLQCRKTRKGIDDFS